MNRVDKYAVPTPLTITPSSQAWGVSSGSCPMVRSKTQAARTDTANWNQRKPPFYATGTAHG